MTMHDRRTTDPVVEDAGVEALGLGPRPDGPCAAVMLAAGVGIAVLGLATVLSEASEPIHDALEALEFGLGVGPLAGKTLVATIAFFATWMIFGVTWRAKELDIRRWFWISLGLGIVGAVLTVPPLFQAFASE